MHRCLEERECVTWKEFLRRLTKDLEEILEGGEEKMEGRDEVIECGWVDGLGQGVDCPNERIELRERTTFVLLLEVDLRMQLNQSTLFFVGRRRCRAAMNAEDLLEDLRIFGEDDRGDLKGMFDLIDLFARRVGQIGHVFPFV